MFIRLSLRTRRPSGLHEPFHRAEHRAQVVDAPAVDEVLASPDEFGRFCAEEAEIDVRDLRDVGDRRDRPTSLLLVLHLCVAIHSIGDQLQQKLVVVSRIVQVRLERLHQAGVGFSPGAVLNCASGLPPFSSFTR